MKITTVGAIVLASVLHLCANALAAQVVGDRVRVTIVPDTTVVGRVTRVADDGFELVRGDMRRYLTYGQIEHIERSEGIKRRWAEGLVYAGAVGGAVGFATAERCKSALIIFEDAACTSNRDRRFIGGALIGGISGALVGSLFKTESWTAIRPGTGESDAASGSAGVTSRPAIFAGDRVRASTRGTWRAGRVDATDDHGFVLVHRGGRRTLGYRDIDALQVSHGLQRYWLPGLGVGLLSGILVQTTVDGSWECLIGDVCEEGETGRTLLGGVIGGAVGAAAGAMIQREQWISVPIGDRSARPRFTPIAEPWVAPNGRTALLLGGWLAF